MVEDEPRQRMMTVDLVEDAGFEAVEAMGSSDAVRILFTDFDMRTRLSCKAPL